jgi:BolA family transcriptional regulator, general stress-responsive regulator
MSEISSQIRIILERTFHPSYLMIRDDSEKHKGHAGHDGRGESHFYLEIAADSFAGKSRVECHRMIYTALDDLMKNRIHALSFKVLAKAPASN